MRITSLAVRGLALDLLFTAAIVWATQTIPSVQALSSAHPVRLGVYLIGVALTAAGCQRIFRGRLLPTLDGEMVAARLRNLPCYKGQAPSDEDIQLARLATMPINVIIALAGLVVMAQAML